MAPESYLLEFQYQFTLTKLQGRFDTFIPSVIWDPGPYKRPARASSGSVVPDPVYAVALIQGLV